MIDNTLKKIDQIATQLKSVNAVRKLLTMLVYMAYLIFRIVSGAGYLALNIVLACLVTFYGAFFLYYYTANRKIMSDKKLHVVDSLCRFARVVLCLVGAGLAVAGFLSVAKELNTLNLVFAVLLPVFLALQLVFDVVYEYATYCLLLLKQGVEADVENAKKTYARPIQAVEGVKDAMEGIASVKSGLKSIARAVFRKNKQDDVQEIAGEDSLPAIDQTGEEK